MQLIVIPVFILISVLQPQVSKSDCKNPATQLELNQCAVQKFHQADSALNSQYQSIFSTLDEHGKQRLKTAERAWLAYRDANCEAESDRYTGGSMQPLIKSSCLELLTSQRMEEIKRIYVKNQ